jgi:hypothetical protein
MRDALSLTFVPFSFHLHHLQLSTSIRPQPTRVDEPRSPSSLLRDVGPNQIFKIRTRCICPFPCQRDAGGSRSLDGGMGELETQGGTHGVGGPCSASRKRTTMKVVVRFLHSFLPATQLITTPAKYSPNTERMTQRQGVQPNDGTYDPTMESTTQQRSVRPSDGTYEPTAERKSQRRSVQANDRTYDPMTERTTQRRRVSPNDGEYDPTTERKTQRRSVRPNNGRYDPTTKGTDPTTGCNPMTDGRTKRRRIQPNDRAYSPTT